MRGRSGFLLLVISLVLGSCKMYDEAAVPAYIYVPAFSVAPTITQKDTSQNIVDVWLSQDAGSKALGCFGLPDLIPVIAKGPTRLRLSAGIKQSGQDDQRLEYIMYKAYDTLVDLQPNETDTIYPVVRYVDGARDFVHENFDSIGFNFEYNAQLKRNGDTIVRVPDKYGNAGQVLLPDTLLEIYTQVFPPYTLNAGVPLYFEFSYKCNIAFDIGLYSTNTNMEVTQFNVIEVNPKEDWNKIYLDLENEIGIQEGKSRGNSYRVFIRFDRSKNFNIAPADIRIFIDNIKLVHL